jgi:hypothetical protein
VWRPTHRSVASALRTRTLQRLTVADVKKLKGDLKVKHDAAKTKYDQNFAIGKPLYEYPNLELDGWSYYRDNAATVDDLASTINDLVDAATAWKKLHDQPAAEPTTPAPAVPPSTQTQTQTQSSQSKRRKPKATLVAPDIVFGTKSYVPAPTPAPAKPPPIPDLPPKLNYIQRSLDKWDGTDHDGKEGSKLTLDDVEKVVAYVKAKWAAKPFKGRGSNLYKDTWQLKISELAKVGIKSATSHLTLSEDVYKALAVPEAGS